MVPDASMEMPPALVRQAPVASRFSSAKARGSICEWHVAQVGFFRCSSSRSRPEAGWPPAPVSGRLGTLGGGGGGGAPRRVSSTHLPRNTGEVRLGYDVTVRRLPWPSRPPRCSGVLNVTRRKRFPSIVRI